MVGDGRVDAVAQRFAGRRDAIDEPVRTAVAERLLHRLHDRELFGDRVDFDPQVEIGLANASPRGAAASTSMRLDRSAAPSANFCRSVDSRRKRTSRLALFNSIADASIWLAVCSRAGKRLGVRERGGDLAAADEIDAADDAKPGDEGDADQRDANPDC